MGIFRAVCVMVGKSPGKKMAVLGTRAPSYENGIHAIFIGSSFYCVKTLAEAWKQQHPCCLKQKKIDR
jgi:hypothetical protein